jgi:hypothetical protein
MGPTAGKEHETVQRVPLPVRGLLVRHVAGRGERVSVSVSV